MVIMSVCCCFFSGEQEIEAMDADDILARQVEQLDKEKRELQIRQKTQEKKVKHTFTVVFTLPRHRRDSHLYIYPLQKSSPQKRMDLARAEIVFMSLNVVKVYVNLLWRLG